MPWHSIGRGRTSAPPLDTRAKAYRAFWRAVRDECAAVADDDSESVSDTNAAQHRTTTCLQQLDDSAHLRFYPNCTLFKELGGRSDATRAACAFLFAAPFGAVCASDALLRAANRSYAAPSAGDWLPFALPERCGGSAHRVYWTLAMRLAALPRLQKTLRERRAASEQAREARGRLERALQHWYDAHLLLAIGIERLARVPRDDSPALAALLARYAPDCHTALCEGDLPDLSAQVEAASFFAAQDAARRECIYVDTFSKALPHRCEVREAAPRVADLAATDAGYFGFVQLALAASLLGIYRRAEYRPALRARRAVYELFFFEPQRERVAPGVHYDELQRTFGLVPLHASVREHGKHATNAHIHYSHWGGAVAARFIEGLRGAARESALRDVGREQAKVMQSGALSARGDNRAKLRSAAQRAASARKLTESASSESQEWREARRRALVLGLPVAQTAPFVSGAHASRTMTRMRFWKNCGDAYYEERLLAGVLPDSGVLDKRGQALPPPRPRAPGVPITYKLAEKDRLPCDQVLPSERTMARNDILYQWITAWSSDSRAQAVNSSKSGAAGWSGPQKRKKSGSVTGGNNNAPREYLFQSVVSLALREYIVFALERWLPALRHELAARVRWSSWETTLQAFGDRLRQRIDARYAATAPQCAPGALLTDYSIYEWMTRAARAHAINSLYVAKRQPFLSRLLHFFALQQERDAELDRTVDAVLPRETGVLIWHALRHYNFRRTRPAIDSSRVPRARDSTVAAVDERDDAECTFERYHELLLPPQIEFMIEPVPIDALDNLPSDGQVDDAWIERELVQKSRFPLGIFHIDDELLRRLADLRVRYHTWPDDSMLQQFVESLGGRHPRAYDFQLLRTYLTIVHTYQETRTFALPLHILRHQMRALRLSHCIPESEPVPQHLMRTLVCVGCARAATMFPADSARPNVMPFGTNNVRFVSQTDDDVVFERVRERGRALAANELHPTMSWSAVLHRRSAPDAPCYDAFCAESDEMPAGWLFEPEKHGLLPLGASEQQMHEHNQQLLRIGELMVPPSERVPKSPDAELVDRRLTLRAAEHAERGAAWPPNADAPLNLVAVGRGKLGEIDFALQLDALVNERVAHYGGLADGSRSFQLYGHSTAGRDARFETLRLADKSPRYTAELKKIKANRQRTQAIERIGERAKRASNRKQHDVKQRRDADAMARYASCQRRQMFEVSLRGRALRAAHLDVNKSRRTDPPVAPEDDFIMACCDCLANARSVDLRPIGDRVVCMSCYRASLACGGAAARRIARSDTTTAAANAQPKAMSRSGTDRVRDSDRQARFSPSQIALCPHSVPAREVCAIDRCKEVASAHSPFCAREVLDDLSVGNETYVYVFFCALHARFYDKFFAISRVVRFSAVRHAVANGQSELANVGGFGSLLDAVMRRAAVSKGTHFASKALAAASATKKRVQTRRRRASKRSETMAAADKRSEEQRAVRDALNSAKRARK